MQFQGAQGSCEDKHMLAWGVFDPVLDCGAEWVRAGVRKWLIAAKCWVATGAGSPLAEGPCPPYYFRFLYPTRHKKPKEEGQHSLGTY